MFQLNHMFSATSFFPSIWAFNPAKFRGPLFSLCPSGAFRSLHPPPNVESVGSVGRSGGERRLQPKRDPERPLRPATSWILFLQVPSDSFFRGARGKQNGEAKRTPCRTHGFHKLRNLSVFDFGVERPFFSATCFDVHKGVYRVLTHGHMVNLGGNFHCNNVLVGSCKSQRQFLLETWRSERRFTSGTPPPTSSARPCPVNDAEAWCFVPVEHVAE